MARLVEFLASHWLAVILLIVAGGLFVRAMRRPGRSGSAAGAFAAGLLGLGGLLLTGLRFELFESTLTVANLLLGLSFSGFLFLAFLLIVGRLWSYRLAVVLGGLAFLGIGGTVLAPLSVWLVEAVRALRGLQFVRPEWLALLMFVPLVFLVSRRSLSGLGPTRKWLAISARAAGIACLAMALAEPRLKRTSENVTVLFVVDRSFSIPQDLDPSRPLSETVDRRWERVRDFIEQSVRRRGPDHRDDQSGLIFFGKRPKLVLPPAAVDNLPISDRLAGSIDGNYSDLGAAIKLALASFPEGTGKRIVFFSDGNENLGNAEEQAGIAEENGVEIDTVALAPGFRNESEVLVQAVEAPPVTTLGQRLPVRVLVRNATPDKEVDGILEVVKTGSNTPIEVEDGPQILSTTTPPRVRLYPGLNVFRFRDRIDPNGDSAFVYRATFTPVASRPVAGGVIASGLPGDRAANNRAATAVVSRGRRRVLLLDQTMPDGKSSHEHLLLTLLREKIDARRLPADKLPVDKTDLGVFLSNFDAVLLCNVPAEVFTNDQMEVIRSNVFDQGCGLVMVGGPDSFGPGGYQQTPIEAALPVDCEIKALKAAGKGGLVLIMHASEMADGNKWQKDIAKLAIQRLGPVDMIGVTQFGGFGGTVSWVIPFQEVGENRQGLLAKIDGMSPGDMPDFDPFLRAAADTLSDERYDLAVKHSIIISDGDPSMSALGTKALADMAANAVTCTTVGVATHGVNEDTKMKQIASSTKDGNGKPGNFYKVQNPNQLPAIYIKESRRVSQAFIFDKPFEPMLRVPGGPAEGLPAKLPPLYGFVRTTKKANLLSEMEIEGPSPFPDQKFPILASWRYGLGKAVAFTSDARTQPGAMRQWWDRDWVGSDMYRNFWKQTVQWVMREAERGRLTLVSEYRDGRVRITADLRDEKDKPLIGVTLRGAVTPPEGGAAPTDKPPVVEFKSRGAGMYEAEFPAEEAGSYFVNVQALEPERDAQGNVVLDPKTGQAKMTVYDAARAGVTVPYSPEFADLESNTPLMKQLAAITNGKYHTEDDLPAYLASGDVFRTAPETVRSLLPFWFWLVFLAAMLLLCDVAVRRISLEWLEVRTASDRFWQNLRQSGEAVMEGGSLDRLSRRKAEVGEEFTRVRAERRFDPDAAPTGEPPPVGADDYVASRPSESSATPPVARRVDEAKPEDEDDTLSRLQRAKRRARDRQDRRDDEQK